MLNTGLAGKAAINHPHNDKQDKLNLLITESSGESNVASGLWTAIPSTNIAIVPGLYILYIEANFASNTNGKRGICILNTTTNVQHSATFAQAISGDHYMTSTYFFRLEAAANMAVRVYQNSGTAIRVKGKLRILRIF